MKLCKKLPAIAVMVLGTFQYAEAAVSFSIDLDASTPDIIDTERSIVAGQDILASVVLVSDGQDGIAGYNFDVLFSALAATHGPRNLSGFSRERLNESVERTAQSADGRTFQIAPNTPDILMTNRSHDAPHRDVPIVEFDDNFNPVVVRDSDGDPLIARTDRLPQLLGDEPSTELGIFGGISAGLTAGSFTDVYDAPILFFTLTGVSLDDGLVNNVNISGEGVLFSGGAAPVSSSDPRVTFNGARLTVSAIPEPSSLAALAMGVGLAGLRRRRRS